MVSIHSLRSPKPNKDSVFGAREDHHMVEIVSMTSDPVFKDETATWCQDFLEELKGQDVSNVLDSAYISLFHAEDANLKKIYGRHLNTLVSLKSKYDPENVFKHAAQKFPFRIRQQQCFTLNISWRLMQLLTFEWLPRLLLLSFKSQAHLSLRNHQKAVIQLAFIK